MVSEKYKKSWSKFEIENLGNYEKIYPSSNNRPFYIAIMDAASKEEDPALNQIEQTDDSESFVELSPKVVKSIKKWTREIPSNLILPTIQSVEWKMEDTSK